MEPPSTASNNARAIEVSRDDPNLEEKFTASVEIVHNLPHEGPITTSTNERLAFYSLYKQATHGPCNTPKPPFWNVVDKFKWEAWNKLGAMKTEDAKAAYVQKLLKKITEVHKDYDMEEWMQGELYDKLVPKFAVIGLQPSDRQSKRRGLLDEDDVEETVKRPETIGEEELLSDSSIEDGSTDVEYSDAVEKRSSKVPSRSSSKTETAPRDRRDSLLRQYSTRIEDELKAISLQISNLSAASEHRHSSLKDMFRRATFHLLAPRGMPWRTIVILIVWPFIANMLVRMLRNFIGV